MKKITKIALLFLLTLTYVFFYTAKADAQTVNIPVYNGTEPFIDIYAGDSGQIQPVLDGLTDTYGNILDASTIQMSYKIENVYDKNCMVIDENGNYTALNSGHVLLTVSGYYKTAPTDISFDNLCFWASINFTISVDPASISLDADALALNASGFKDENTGFWYSSAFASVKINCDYALSSDFNMFGYSYTNSKKASINMNCYIENNTLNIAAYITSKNPIENSTLTCDISGREFPIELTFSTVYMNKRSLVAAKGKKATLKLKGTSEKPKWTSSNPKIVSVSKNGNIRCRKKGNAVITATIGKCKTGCVVSVVSDKMVKVIKYGTYIGTNWKYSQPKRMSPGFYDCSSLVWKAYKKAGKYICNAKSYAPVAADIAKWSKKNGKVIAKSYTSKQVDKMKFNPGDLAFQTGADNGRYKGIYHVEMFTGYTVFYDEKGKPHMNELWAARSEGYYGGGLLVIRPYK